MISDTGYYQREEIFTLGFRTVGEHVRVSRKACFYDVTGSIGDHSRIDDFVIIKGHVEIGRYVHICAFCVIGAAHGRVVFGDGSALGCWVSVYTASDDLHQTALISSTVPDEFRAILRGDVVFGVGVGIGAHSVVMPNSTIGDGTTVGAFSLVRGTVPEGRAMLGRAGRLHTVGRRDVARVRVLLDALVRGEPPPFEVGSGGGFED